MDNEKLVENGAAQNCWWKFTEEGVNEAQVKVYCVGFVSALGLLAS